MCLGAESIWQHWLFVVVVALQGVDSPLTAYHMCCITFNKQVKRPRAVGAQVVEWLVGGQPGVEGINM